ncbi:Os05g0591450, partial [Oryza sativa Japonica Group]
NALLLYRVQAISVASILDEFICLQESSCSRRLDEHLRWMLLAVEVGGFFSSSASGYRNGLALLLLGHKGEEKPVKVTPWNHYRLVGGGEAEPASEENNVPSGKCASFICFGCPPARLKGVSPPKLASSDTAGNSSEQSP